MQVKNYLEIRTNRPTYSEDYFKIFENLEEYTSKIFSVAGILASNVVVLEGELGAVLKITDEQAKKFILKINCFHDDLYSTIYFFGKLKELNIPCPKVLLFDDSRKLIPFDFAIFEFLEGVEAKNLPKELQYQAGKIIGKTLVEIHAHKTPGFGWPLHKGGWATKSWLEAFRKMYFEEANMKRKLEIFTKKECEQIEKLTFFNPELEISEPRLIHSDVSASNFLFIQKAAQVELSGIVDVGSLVGGDLLFDLCDRGENEFDQGIVKTYFLIKPLSPDEIRRLQLLRLAKFYWSTCWRYGTKRDYEQTKKEVLRLLANFL